MKHQIVAWESSHKACVGAACEVGSCIPGLQDGQRLCVHVDGFAECPDTFPVRLDVATGIDDTRGCSACSCGDVQGECSGSVALREGCVGVPQVLYEQDVDTCVMGLPFGQVPASYSIQGNFGATLEGCPPSQSVATGSVAVQGARTVCCLP